MKMVFGMSGRIIQIVIMEIGIHGKIMKMEMESGMKAKSMKIVIMIIGIHGKSM